MELFHEWTGRVDDSEKGKRLHQVIRNVKGKELKRVTNRHFGIVGFESDEGVRRNKGRVGASKAPNEIRRLLANIPYHYDKENLIDIGNVSCHDTNLEDAQIRLSDEVAKLVQHNYTPIILGGGHETFYGHYLGVRKALGEEKKIGMINLDAHFDLRMDTIATSGTMFRQILENDPQADYLCIGLQDLGNTEQLFLTAKELGAEYVLETDVYPIEKTFKKIDAFANKQDYVIYTLCTDVIDQAYAPGVSAPSPFGLDPNTVRALSEHIVKQNNFLSFDVSEVNPKYDVADNTVRLISYLIVEMMMHMNKA